MSAAERLARKFHETYERLAGDHGYETRRESAVAWEQVPEANRELMVATCQEIVDWLFPILIVGLEGPE